LPPPQYYELSRLNGMKDIDEIVEFAKARSPLGTTAICPVQFRCKDGLVHVMPGDDLYPQIENFAKPIHNMEQHIEKTCEEMRAVAKNMHRAEFSSLYEVRFYNNIKQFNGHLSPVTDRELSPAKL
jgi:nucleoside diphosphate-linked moiety X motif 19, mitochondrial